MNHEQTGENSAMSSNSVAEAYSSEPWWYDLRGFFILSFAYCSTLSVQMNCFGPHFGKRHLEAACGTGTLLELLLRWRRWKGLPEVEIVGVDYANSMLEGARRRFSRSTNMSFLLGDITRLPFDDGTFDTVNVANAIHCFARVDEALLEIHRVLEPGGTIAANVLLSPRGAGLRAQIARTINDWGIRKGILHTPYRREDIRGRIVRAGFEILREEQSGNSYQVLARKPDSASS